MRTSIAIVALFTLASISQLPAQDGRTGTGATTSPDMSRQLGAGEKIPPHQQPKASDVPSGNSSDQMSAEDKALDKKLKGICRGC